MADETIRILMKKTVCPDLLLAKVLGLRADVFLIEGKEYAAVSNRNGAISAICENGEAIGVKPSEFEFLEAPEWVLEIWRKQGLY